MSQLINISDYYIDPNKVISVVPTGGLLHDAFFIHVDMGGYTASYEIENDPDSGWTPESAAETINEGRTK